MKNELLLYSTGNYIQCIVITYIGKDSEKIHTYVYIYIQFNSVQFSHSVMSDSL